MLPPNFTAQNVYGVRTHDHLGKATPNGQHNAAGEPLFELAGARVDVVLTHPPETRPMRREQALNLVAWLSVQAGLTIEEIEEAACAVHDVNAAQETEGA